MSARFTEIEASLGARRPLEARLDAYPGLRAKVEALVDIVENAAGGRAAQKVDHSPLGK